MITSNMINIRDATDEDLKSIPTRQLMTLRDDCYRNNKTVSGIHYDDGSFNECATVFFKVIGSKKNEKYDPTKPESRGNRISFQLREGIKLHVNQILAELNTRPHVPNKEESRKLRQERAKAGH